MNHHINNFLHKFAKQEKKTITHLSEIEDQKRWTRASEQANVKKTIEHWIGGGPNKSLSRTFNRNERPVLIPMSMGVHLFQLIKNKHKNVDVYF